VLFTAAPTGERITVRTPPRAPHQPGEVLRVRIDPARRHVFSGDGGERLT
jgi:hypothetical protein